MPRVTPQEAANRLGQAITQSGTRYAEGVAAVTENPAGKAIAAKQKWANAMQDAIANDRFAKGLAGVTLTSWKQAVTAYGVQRYSSSGTKATNNYLKFAQDFFPYLQQVQDEIANLPNETFQDSLNRMLLNATRLHEWRNL